jgi:ribosome-associated protein
MLTVTDRITIDEAELEESFIRSTGPGGQNVNKVETAVQLRFRAMGSPGLPEAMKERLAVLAGRRLNQEGEIVITARRFRTRELNRQDARARLVELLRDAAEEPIRRRATRPTRASKERKLQAKKQRARVKGLRGRVKDG